MNTNAVLAFFSGKSLVNATAAMAVVEASIAQGFWAPGARTVRAALGKSNLAKKAVKGADVDTRGGYGYGNDDTDARGNAFFQVYMILEYGALDADYLAKAPKWADLIAGEHPKLAEALRAYVDAFLPLGQAMAKLDNARPTPVFTMMAASPTVSRTLAALGANDVTICPMDFTREDRLNPTTNVVESVPVARLVWPEGTKHNTSRWNGCQCQACGHAIRRPDNWLPLVLATEEGPKSLWVGMDCAKTLFNVDFKGSLEINGGREA